MIEVREGSTIMGWWGVIDPHFDETKLNAPYPKNSETLPKKSH